ncbi:MAG: hypothetical protein H6969_06690 [Gammaproteobacteria bacterium]|nr:hypothetical protein [Gammaproteobacteria bacterium]
MNLKTAMNITLVACFCYSGSTLAGIQRSADAPAIHAIDRTLVVAYQDNPGDYGYNNGSSGLYGNQYSDQHNKAYPNQYGKNERQDYDGAYKASGYHGHADAQDFDNGWNH